MAQEASIELAGDSPSRLLFSASAFGQQGTAVFQKAQKFQEVSRVSSKPEQSQPERTKSEQTKSEQIKSSPHNHRRIVFRDFGAASVG